MFDNRHKDVSVLHVGFKPVSSVIDADVFSRDVSPSFCLTPVGRLVEDTWRRSEGSLSSMIGLTPVLSPSGHRDITSS